VRFDVELIWRVPLQEGVHLHDVRQRRPSASPQNEIVLPSASFSGKPGAPGKPIGQPTGPPGALGSHAHFPAPRPS
jgi:hypothetical protein